jgi:hypothetical protein
MNVLADIEALLKVLWTGQYSERINTEWGVDFVLPRTLFYSTDLFCGISLLHQRTKLSVVTAHTNLNIFFLHMMNYI